jgi:DtxR family Mn-dependent transcriptional regulator
MRACMLMAGDARIMPGGAMNRPRWRPRVDIWKEFDQNIITHSAAHHLMAIDDLVGTLGYARVSDVARQLNITRGSVSISLRPLKKAGLVEQDENRHLRLSERGRALVAAIKTKRHLMQRLLAEILGVEDAQAEIDACKLEHLVSNQTAQRLLSFLHFLDSDAGQGGRFVRAWREYEIACQQTPRECPSCEDECLAEKIDAPHEKRE